MMDKSETYIKMCKKAEEIQKIRNHIYEEGDYCHCPECGLFIHCEGKLYDFDEIIWLPRQDQLQEMIGEDIYTNIKNAMWSILDDLHKFALSSNAFNEFIPLTMEQLWLSFVMKEKYGKIWNGEDWIKLN